MNKLLPCHGGTDAGPEPLHDFSTNANPFGPCPSVLAAVRGADLTRYPNPAYTRLRSALAEHHGVTAQRIVVGAGASELILRLVRSTQGSVHLLGPTFSEYGRCARVARRSVFEAADQEEFLHLQRTRRGIGFLCCPNNPTGTVWPLDFIAAASLQRPLVVDLAYAPLCPAADFAQIEKAAAGAFRLYAPNKAFGLCGIRAAYLVAPRAYPRLEALAPSWVLDRGGEAFLTASIQPEALSWLAHCRPHIAAGRAELARDLTQLGLPVRESPATFLLARVGEASRITVALRAQSIRVRDASSFGLPEWLRLSIQAPASRRLLLQQLPPLLSS